MDTQNYFFVLYQNSDQWEPLQGAWAIAFLEDLTADEAEAVRQAIELLDDQLLTGSIESQMEPESEALKNRGRYLVLSRQARDQFLRGLSINEGSLEPNKWDDLALAVAKHADEVRRLRDASNSNFRQGTPQGPAVVERVQPHGKMESRDESSHANQQEAEPTPAIASIMVAGVSLNCLSEIRRYYPTAITDSEARDLHQRLTESIEMWFQSESCGRFRSVYERPAFATITNESIVVLISTIAMAMIGEVPADEIASAMDRVFARCNEEVVEPVKSLAHRVSEVEVFNCITVDPTAGPEFADPRRALHLLCEYWGILRQLVSIESHSYVYRIPHPLLPIIVNLRQRIDSCLKQLEARPGWEDARSSIDLFMETLTSGNPDDLQLVPEYTNRRLAELELFLEQSRAAVGRKTFPLTRSEEAFFKVARLDVSRYEQDVAEGKERVNAYLHKVGEERRKKITPENLRVPLMSDDKSESAMSHDAPPPPPPLLIVDLDPPQVTLKGKPFSVAPDGALMVKVLLDADGDWVAGPTMAIARPDRTKEKLPKPVQDLIEPSPGKGFRISRKTLAELRQNAEQPRQK